MTRAGDVVFLVFLLAALLKNSWWIFFVGLLIGCALNVPYVFRSKP